MLDRTLLRIAIVFFGWANALASVHVLNGEPVALSKAQTWCIAQMGPVPNWDGPGHPDCKMVWRVLAERNGRTLYSARYAWPSPARSVEPLRVLTEVLYEGIPGSRVVRRLYAVQEDEAHIHLEPLHVVTIGGAAVIESRVCLIGTGECGRELAAWTDAGIAPIADHTVAEIRSRLPAGYDLRMNPELDLASGSGTGRAFAQRDADCCPSADVAFKLRLDARELHAEEIKVQRRPA
jgi:hypothetical protein